MYQNEAVASRVKMSEMQSQKDGFDNQMAKAALASSAEKLILLDSRVMKSEHESSSAWTSYDMMACGYAPEPEPIARVRRLTAKFVYSIPYCT